MEMDISFIADRSGNTNVRFVNLFWRYDKPWVDRKVRSVNLRIDPAALGCGKSHIHVIETTSFQREDCHLNLHGKKTLTLPIAKS